MANSNFEVLMDIVIFRASSAHDADIGGESGEAGTSMGPKQGNQLTII
jgi:hypothetical protein